MSFLVDSTGCLAISRISGGAGRGRPLSSAAPGAAASVCQHVGGGCTQAWGWMTPSLERDEGKGLAADLRSDPYHIPSCTKAVQICIGIANTVAALSAQRVQLQQN